MDRSYRRKVQIVFQNPDSSLNPRQRVREILSRPFALYGGRNADAFIVARAYAIGGTVVTMERLKPNAVRVPNICQHFKIPFLDLEGFMESEGWEF